MYPGIGTPGLGGSTMISFRRYLKLMMAGISWQGNQTQGSVAIKPRLTGIQANKHMISGSSKPTLMAITFGTKDMAAQMVGCQAYVSQGMGGTYLVVSQDQTVAGT